jgi:beta-galactosidase
VFTLPFDENQMNGLLEKGKWNPSVAAASDSTASGNPAFFKFAFTVETPADTFLDFAGWGKGCVWVNGFNIGRFWEIGPQKRLYIPGPLLHSGENRIIIFETEGKRGTTIDLCGEPKW